MINSTYPLSTNLENTSRLIYGCMGLGGGWNNNPITKNDITQAHHIIDTALEAGITQFDHADIYTFTKAEQVFGKVLKERPELRNQISLQSKCSIRFEHDGIPKHYDLSPEWIESSIEGILQRLNIEQLDVMMLHRPDPLWEPELIAKSVDKLVDQGKIKHLGVSNMSSHQMAHLQRSLTQPIVANQLEMSLQSQSWLEGGISGLSADHNATNFPAGTIEYCQGQNIQLQSWGSLCQGLFSGRNLDGQSESIRKTAELVNLLANKYQVSTEAIVLAWLMRHPANIQPVIGTTHLARIKACSQATTINLSRYDWYNLYVTARGEELP